MSVVLYWCAEGSINSQEYKSFEIYAVTINISMTEYNHWISSLADRLFYHYSLWGKWVWYFWSLAYFRFFEAINKAFEVQFFQGFIFISYQRHW